MIFAAGLGTRLRPLTDTMPKALVPVARQPLLWHVLKKLEAGGFNRIVINVHHFAQQIVDYLQANDNFGLDIRISDETDCLLETGGGIKKALSLLDPHAPVLIHNVDILSNADLAKLYSLLEEASAEPADAVLLVSQRQTKRYLLFDDGMCLMGWKNIETGEVKSPNEHLSIINNPLNYLAFSGIHVLSPSLFPLLREWPKDRVSIIDFYLSACASRRIMGHEQQGLRLLDIGKTDTLTQADTFLSDINTTQQIN